MFLIRYKSVKNSEFVAVFQNLTEFINHQYGKNYANLPVLERTIFQLSAVAFWDVSVAQDTINFIEAYSLMQNPEFQAFYPIFADPVNVVSFAPISGGSVCTNVETVLYKDGSIMLSSMQNYNFQQLASQQYPWGATTGTIAIYGYSGPGTQSLSNTHLPNIKQIENVALIKYDSSLINLYGPTLGMSLSFFFPCSDCATMIRSK